MNLDTMMVKFLLEHATSFEWSIQGLGMLRLYLDKATRLHVWSPMAKRPEVTTLHDHPWDFTSQIVSGRLTNVRYMPDTLPAHAHPFNYMRQQIVCGPGGGVDAEPDPVHLFLCEAKTYWPGDLYYQHAEDIHESLPEPGTVTVITREFKKDTEHAHVFYPIEREWVSAEPRIATPDEVSRITGEALDLWDRWHTRR